MSAEPTIDYDALLTLARGAEKAVELAMGGRIPPESLVAVSLFRHALLPVAIPLILSAQRGERLREALAVRDATVAKCPINNPIDGKRERGACLVCGATCRDHCGVTVAADYALVEALRTALQSNEEEPK